MKARLKENNGFKPITIEITIESKDELLEMYWRHNVMFSIIKQYGNLYRVDKTPYPQITTYDKIYDILESEVDKRGLDK